MQTDTTEAKDKAQLVAGDIRAASTLLGSASAKATDPEVQAMIEDTRSRLVLILQAVWK
jgi:hypothetical protein